VAMMSAFEAATAAPNTRKLFNSFVKKFGKSYSPEEVAQKFDTFQSNKAFVDSHNAAFEAGNVTFQVALNEFADLTSQEFAFRFTGLSNDISTAVFSKNRSPFAPQVADIPTAVDWRNHTPAIVTPIKNQGSCGSCWSFSATGSTEGQYALAKKAVAVGLSEQNLVDCSKKEGNLGCNGGLMDQAFEYIIKNDGIDTEASYPYTAKTGRTCQYSASKIGATLSSYKDVAKGSEADLTNAVATVGPVSVAIDASHNSFQFYRSGVYNEAKCSTTQLDHGVLAVGYGVSDSTPYYLVKNSWGTSWGQEGYIWMSRNGKNQCGIATSASYPIV